MLQGASPSCRAWSKIALASAVVNGHDQKNGKETLLGFWMSRCWEINQEGILTLSFVKFTI